MHTVARARRFIANERLLKRYCAIPQGNFPAWVPVKTATTKTATHTKRRQPKRQHIQNGDNQNGDTSKTATRQNGDTSKTATTKTATYQNGDTPKRRHTKRAGILRRFGMSPFWLYPKRRHAKTATNPKRRHVKTATIQFDLSPKLIQNGDSFT